MRKNDNYILFLGFLILLGIFFVFAYLHIIGNLPETFPDTVTPSVWRWSAKNNSGEMRLLYYLTLGGTVLIFFYWLLLDRRKDLILTEISSGKAPAMSVAFIIGTVAFSLTRFAIYGYKKSFLLVLFAIIVFIISRDLVPHGICAYITSLYALVGLCNLCIFMGGKVSFNFEMLSLIAFLPALLPLIFKSRKKVYFFLIAAESLLIPPALLVFFRNKYMYRGNLISIDIPISVQVLLYIVLYSFMAEAAVKLISALKDKTDSLCSDLKSALSVGTCITICAFNRFDGTGAIISEDLHHPFENIMGFHQIFALGQTPFKEYIPVSGLYSVVHGAFFHIFGEGGVFADYHITQNLFYLFCLTITFFLLKNLVSRPVLLAIAFLFYLPSYNRYAFILPIMLLLIQPKLMARPVQWFLAWFTTSIFHGLYYPVYGAATCLAFFPLGIYLFVRYIREKKIKEDIKKASFWLSISACIGLFILSVPLLFGTLKHVLSLSGISYITDGYARFDTYCPDYFFPLFKSQSVRTALLYVITFIVPAMLVWFFIIVTVTADKNNVLFTLSNEKRVNACCLSLAIMPMVAYIFSFQAKLDQSLYTRGIGIIFVASVLLLVVLSNLKMSKLYGILLFFAVSFLCLFDKCETTLGFTSKPTPNLSYCYQVPDNYIFTENSEIPKLGYGFINSDIYDKLTETKAAGFTASNLYLGYPGEFGENYLLDIPSSGFIEYRTAVGFDAAKEALHNAEKYGSLMGSDILPLMHYYLYDALLTSGKYIFNAETGLFEPVTGKNTPAEVLKANKQNTITYPYPTRLKAMDCYDFYYVPASWGMSMKTLEHCFPASDTVPGFELSAKENGYEIAFDHPVPGQDADFLYLEFADCDNPEPQSAIDSLLYRKTYNPGCKVLISYLDDDGNTCNIVCDIHRGKLLIPLGACKNWLLHGHSGLMVQLFDASEAVLKKDLADIRLLRLRDIE
ncbi:MAG: hypothetical protein K6E32_10205 [Lachnospiraceae bacterium]|nr:hypothetical protein [Lachnospiraceae bacterium]